ncbi:MAG TPA: methionine synthase [Mycobacteriales bacterium]|nr:methionine synthase [Mycobacteriales bacterium]
MDVSWPRAAATGVGSLPGDRPLEAATLVAGELPDLVHLPELPARGPGADIIGRAAAMLVDLHVDLTPSGWRLAARGGRDERRARDYLAEDLDSIEVAALGCTGVLKVQCAGPWTLAAMLETPRGHRALGDAGARRDVLASLAEGAATHVAEVARRVPGATVVLQLDEPALRAVADGRLPTASGFGAVAAVPVPELVAALREVVDAAGAAVGVHCCASDPPLDVVRAARPAFVSVDLSTLDPRRHYDDLGQCVDDGAVLLCGIVPSAGSAADLPQPSRADLAPVLGLWRDLALPADRLATQVVVTPTCGLAGASPDYARAALRHAREIARRLADEAGAA